MHLYIRKRINRIKTVRFSLFFTLLAISAIPLIYMLIRSALHFPSDHHYNLHSNLIWGMYVFEVAIETLIFPIYYLFGITIKDNKKTANKIKTTLLLFIGVFSVLTLVMFFISPMLISNRIKDVSEAANVISYIRIELFAIVLSAIAKFLLIVLQLKGNKKSLFGYLALYIGSMILMDSLIVAPYAPYSLGVNGIAITNIVASLVVLIYSYLYIRHEFNFKEFKKDKLSFKWFHLYYHVGEHAFIDAVLLNADRILFLIAVGSGIHGYLDLNSFFGVFIMLPFIALGDTLKCDLATSINYHHKAGVIKANVQGYMFVNLALIIIMVVASIFTVPLFNSLANIHYFEEGISSSLATIIPLMIVIYSIKAFQNIYDSAFFGLGELGYMTKQAILVTVIVYLPAIIVLRLGVNFDMWTLTLVLLIVIIVDAIATLYYYRFMLKTYEEGKGDPSVHHYPIKDGIAEEFINE